MLEEPFGSDSCDLNMDAFSTAVPAEHTRALCYPIGRTRLAPMD
jgi:predicted membrane chloride channel (bestrophin family)